MVYMNPFIDEEPETQRFTVGKRQNQDLDPDLAPRSMLMVTLLFCPSRVGGMVLGLNRQPPARRVPSFSGAPGIWVATSEWRSKEVIHWVCRLSCEKDAWAPP